MLATVSILKALQYPSSMDSLERHVTIFMYTFCAGGTDNYISGICFRPAPRLYSHINLASGISHQSFYIL